MGGDLAVTSEIGKGSRFRLEIPVREGIASMVTEKTDSRRRFRLEAGHPPCRVLVADDMEDSRVFLVQTLENAGFEVQEANDGREAVAAFSRWRPQLVLMDKRMPNMNGDEAIERTHPIELISRCFRHPQNIGPAFRPPFPVLRYRADKRADRLFRRVWRNSVTSSSHQTPFNPKRSSGLNSRLDGLVRPIFFNRKRPSHCLK
jgi:hypothetical protein